MLANPAAGSCVNIQYKSNKESVGIGSICRCRCLTDEKIRVCITISLDVRGDSLKLGTIQVGESGNNNEFQNGLEGAVMQVCPECENPLTLAEDEVEEGEVVICEECGAEYEVINTDPLELSKVEEHGIDEGALAFNDEEEE